MAFNCNPIAGEEVRIYTAVQNQSSSVISGTVAFLVNGDIVGQTTFAVPPNDIRSISIPYTFTGGEFDVSAYIMNVGSEPVTYTTVSKRPIVVSAGTPVTATSTVKNVSDDVVEKAEEVLKETTPVIERVAQRIEDVRDSVVGATSTATTTISAPDATPTLHNTKDSFVTFVNDTKHVLATDGVAVWKKIVGVVLGILALIARLWYMWLTLFIAFTFWRLVRGRRIG